MTVVSQASGGKGQDTGLGGGEAVAGNGGGGGGGMVTAAFCDGSTPGKPGGAATETKGGDGTTTYNGVGKPGVGAGIYATGGAAGYSGAGSGGGSRGRHGQALYLQVRGSISGSGSVLLSGQDGGNGGATQDGYTGCNCAFVGIWRGGGGGGGAGGSGGALLVRGAALPDTIVVDVNGGSGGSGGIGGWCNPAAAGTPGGVGFPGYIHATP